MKLIFYYHFSQVLRRRLLAAGLTLILITGVALTANPSLLPVFQNKLYPIYGVKSANQEVALTFDISWGNKTPLPVIEILKKHNVKATFFLSGPWVRQYPEIPQRIKADGHEIASHGHRHINLSTISREEIITEINKAHLAIKDVTGVDANLIRTPNGDYDNKVISTAREINYQVIQWDVDSLDWKNPGVGAITDRVLRLAHPGAIILMHASDTCQQTTAALPAVIEGLRAQGYQFYTVSELLQRNNNQVEP